MIDQALCAATFLAALGSGLIAGAFFALSAFVLTALSRLPDQGGIAAMQAISTSPRSMNSEGRSLTNWPAGSGETLAIMLRAGRPACR